MTGKRSKICVFHFLQVGDLLCCWKELCGDFDSIDDTLQQVGVTFSNWRREIYLALFDWCETYPAACEAQTCPIRCVLDIEVC